MIKRRDDFASTGDVTGKSRASVKTDRTMDEITAGKSKRKIATKKAAAKTRTGRTKTKSKRSRAEMPTDVEPQLATLIDRAPEGDDWVHEIKYDGYRMLAYLAGGEVKMVSRNRNDWSGRHVVAAPGNRQAAGRRGDF